MNVKTKKLDTGIYSVILDSQLIGRVNAVGPAFWKGHVFNGRLDTPVVDSRKEAVAAVVASYLETV